MSKPSIETVRNLVITLPDFMICSSNGCYQQIEIPAMPGLGYAYAILNPINKQSWGSSYFASKLAR
ncbi:hypothetical protein [Nostoc sp. FACHB-133]|uniref:hypothetical protein n=1 Tax=Nostoc sp. FACHB-133 TaxID=2692835 RepID=UPI001688E4D5|nr:hypothetical protein [Nostoc sp. FACHB-133]MBD2524696.1 hypothetical protein [Nostoc sp. FACHB-133]